MGLEWGRRAAEGAAAVRRSRPPECPPEASPPSRRTPAAQPGCARESCCGSVRPSGFCLSVEPGMHGRRGPEDQSKYLRCRSGAGARDSRARGSVPTGCEHFVSSCRLQLEIMGCGVRYTACVKFGRAGRARSGTRRGERGRRFGFAGFPEWKRRAVGSSMARAPRNRARETSSHPPTPPQITKLRSRRRRSGTRAMSSTRTASSIKRTNWTARTSWARARSRA